MAEFGLTPDDMDPAAVDIWPDNEVIKDVFVAMSTQWRHGFSGPTGLDYAALPTVQRAAGVVRNDFPDVFDGLRVMEQAALEVMRKRRPKPT